MKYDWTKASEYWTERISRADDSQSASLYYGAADYINAQYDRWEQMITLRQIGGSMRGQQVLDVGVGAGRWFLRLIKEGACATGTDISPGLIGSLEQRVREDTPEANYRLVISPSHILPFQDQKFATVICTGVLEHLPTLHAILTVRELSRVTAKGGLIVLVINNASNPMLQRSEDNPYRLSRQLDNGYFAGLTDWRKVRRELQRSEVRVARIASNPYFAALRQVARQTPLVSEEAFARAVDLDLTGYADTKFGNELCDQYIVFGIKGGSANEA